MRRAKCNRSNSPNGTSAFFGSAIPGCDVMVASTPRSAGAWPVLTAATIVNCDCGVTDSELQAEVDQALLGPVDLTEIEIGTDQADLVPYPMRDQRGLRVVEHDAFLAVEPARTLVDLGDDRFEAERPDAVPFGMSPAGLARNRSSSCT